MKKGLIGQLARRPGVQHYLNALLIVGLLLSLAFTGVRQARAQQMDCLNYNIGWNLLIGSPSGFNVVGQERVEISHAIGSTAGGYGVYRRVVLVKIPVYANLDASNQNIIASVQVRDTDPARQDIKEEVSQFRNATGWATHTFYLRGDVATNEIHIAVDLQGTLGGFTQVGLAPLDSVICTLPVNGEPTPTPSATSPIPTNTATSTHTATPGSTPTPTMTSTSTPITPTATASNTATNTTTPMPTLPPEVRSTIQVFNATIAPPSSCNDPFNPCGAMPYPVPMFTPMQVSTPPPYTAMPQPATGTINPLHTPQFVTNTPGGPTPTGTPTFLSGFTGDLQVMGTSVRVQLSTLQAMPTGFYWNGTPVSVSALATQMGSGTVIVSAVKGATQLGHNRVYDQLYFIILLLLFVIAVLFVRYVAALVHKVLSMVIDLIMKVVGLILQLLSLLV